MSNALLIAAGGAAALSYATSSSSTPAPTEESPVQLPGYIDGRPVLLDCFPIGDGFYLRTDAAIAFEAMRDAAGSAGVVLKVNSAFRTQEQQQRLYDLYKAGSGALASPAGYGAHQAGVAVDLDTGSSLYWLTANAGRFYFARTVSIEPWHWEFLA